MIKGKHACAKCNNYVKPMFNANKIGADSLKYYNRLAGTDYPMPEFVFSNTNDIAALNVIIMLIKSGNISAYSYKNKKIYLVDSFTDFSLTSSEDHEKLIRTRRAVSHQLVHYFRDVHGCAVNIRGRHVQDIEEPEKQKLFMALEIGCAYFVSGMHSVRTNRHRSMTRVLNAAYNGVSTRASDLLSGTYAQVVKYGGRLSDGLSSIVDFFDLAIPDKDKRRIDQKYHDAGTSLATVIYAANRCDAKKTATKLLTMNYDELVRELTLAARPEVGNAIKIMDRKLKNRNKIYA